MLVYLLLYISFLIPAILVQEKNGSLKSYRTYYFLMFLFLFTSGVRDLIGGYDVYVYRSIFLNDVDESGFGYGFKAFFKGIKLFTNSEYIMFFVTACVITITTFTNLKKYSSYIYLALFIFFCKFYLMSYVYLRQAIAMGIVWFSIQYVYKKQLLKFLSVIFLAFLFHSSALIFVVVYFIDRKFKKEYYLFVFLLFLLFATTPLIDPILTYFFSLDDRYENYGSNFNVNLNFLYIAEALLCLLVHFLYYDKVKDPKKWLLYNGFFIYALVQLLAAKKGIFIRLTWFYLIFYCIILSSFINDFSFNRKVYKPILIIAFTLLFLRMLFIWDGGDFIPYKSIFDDTKRESIWEHLK